MYNTRHVQQQITKLITVLWNHLDSQLRLTSINIWGFTNEPKSSYAQIVLINDQLKGCAEKDP